ncbi:tetratricopeptide repeat-containing sensor histidine kinase [Christiangramia marina]|uniref:tetratricopeptide repeat-containing sensor histidine kinase n=1 Tax=Christiangramia marina TaxID=409436 RepID=UPI003AA99D4D
MLVSNCSFEDHNVSFNEQDIQSYIADTDDQSLLETYLNEIQEDSIKRKFIFKTSYKFYKENDSARFRYWNTKSRNFSNKRIDTLGIAESYWDLANFFYYNNLKDSSYFYYNRAFKNYNDIKASFYAGRMLLNMAVIQSDARDYTGSEITTINSIRLLEPLKRHKQLYMAYNNLGIVYNGMHEFEDAIKYHELALYHKKKLNPTISEAPTLNNIGVVYQNMGNYSFAKNYFDRALVEKNLLQQDPKLYAMLIDNLAYNNFKLGEVEGVEKNLRKSLSLRDSLNHTSGMAINYIHLGEYYLRVHKDTLAAISNFRKSRELAISNNNFRDLLSSLIFLINVDPERENKHLKQYIEIRDSIAIQDRSLRNKFARIKFETDQFIEENKTLNYQQQWIIISFSILLIFVTLVYIIRSQRVNNRKLILEKQQKDANEEIYNLLLTQQQKVEEAKQREKYRISSELHDGILSKLFGIRMTLESLNDDNDPDSILTRFTNIEELQRIESEIREISHDLANDREGKQVDLIEIIQEFVQNNEKISGIQISLQVDKEIDWLIVNNKIKIHLYRIVQELVFNAIKYSDAQKISIIFKSLKNKIQVQVLDDGNGFDIQKTKKGLGIKNVYSRTNELGGDADVESNSTGTKFKILIPSNL